MSRGIVYEYEDGGRYCGEWEENRAHGYGVCTGPEGAGLYEGLWLKGDQSSGVYTWPSGQKYMGRWHQGLRDGLGKETKPDGTEYSGEFNQDRRGPFGVLTLPNGAVYSGTWANGVQSGEGVETYADGGVYRGQYKNGGRYGHGTRSSAAYEHSEGSQRRSDLLKTSISIPRSSGSAASLLPDSNSQLYEGEWKEDKRHGHGVMKVSGCYTYYGEWESNMRTGYGVMMSSDGRKEEGQWLSGKLVHVLKRKKVSLKSHQLEPKVKQAHTLALQAADTARNKAVLAETRSQVAGAKSRSALKTAQQALKDSQTARDKAELHKSAPRVAESLKSPMIDSHGEFPSSDDQRVMHLRGLGAQSFSSLDYLGVRGQMEPSSSYENIHTVFSQSSLNSSESSLNGRGGEEEGSLQLSEDADFGGVRKRREFQRKTTSASSSWSSADQESIDYQEKQRQRQHQLLEMSKMKVSESDSSYQPKYVRRRSDTEISGSRLKVGRNRRRSLSDTEENVEGEEEEMRRARKRDPHRVDETTGDRELLGEVGHGDVTDDELPEDNPRGPRPKKLTVPPPLVKKASISLDMLTQMANWNRMVAYINFVLLVFLLVLILIVVISMNYYYIVSQSAVPQNPAGFMTPLA